MTGNCDSIAWSPWGGLSCSPRGEAFEVSNLFGFALRCKERPDRMSISLASFFNNYRKTENKVLFQQQFHCTVVYVRWIIIRHCSYNIFIYLLFASEKKDADEKGAGDKEKASSETKDVSLICHHCFRL